MLAEPEILGVGGRVDGHHPHAGQRSPAVVLGSTGDLNPHLALEVTVILASSRRRGEHCLALIVGRRNGKGHIGNGYSQDKLGIRRYFHGELAAGVCAVIDSYLVNVCRRHGGNKGALDRITAGIEYRAGNGDLIAICAGRLEGPDIQRTGSRGRPLRGAIGVRRGNVEGPLGIFAVQFQGELGPRRQEHLEAAGGSRFMLAEPEILGVGDCVDGHHPHAGQRSPAVVLDGTGDLDRRLPLEVTVILASRGGRGERRLALVVGRRNREGYIGRSHDQHKRSIRWN